MLTYCPTSVSYMRSLRFGKSPAAPMWADRESEYLLLSVALFLWTHLLLPTQPSVSKKLSHPEAQL